MTGFDGSVSGHHGRVNGSLVRSPGAQATASVPQATRTRRPGWRDPRLWVGILIVAVSVLAGARLLAAADDTVSVWAVAGDAGPGAELTTDDLVAERVRFPDGDDLAGYFRVDDELPAHLRLLRGVGAGELLPRAAVGSATDAADTVELPVAVEDDQVPPAVRSGSVVDVYLLGKGANGHATASTRPVLAEATVVDAPSLDAGFGATTGRRQLVLAVPDADAKRFFDAVGRSDDPRLTVVRRS
jgi:hypothetical protein